MSFGSTSQAEALANTLPLLAPDEVPATMDRTPHDFGSYVYIGTAIEIVDCKKKNGRIVSYPAPVARLIFREHLVDGAMAEIEMTCSLRDLENGRHPQAEEAESALYAHYKMKTQRMARPALKPQRVVTTHTRQPMYVADASASLYAVLNNAA